MDVLRCRDLSAKKLLRYAARGEVFGLKLSRDPRAVVLGLPLEKHEDAVMGAYGVDDPGAILLAPRVNTGPTADKGLSDRVLLDIAVNQVDEDGDIVGGTIYILTYYGEDTVALVPASPYWRTRVEREGG